MHVHPLMLSGIAAAALAGTLALFVYLKSELCAERGKAKQSAEAVASQLSEMQSAMAGLRKVVAEIEERPIIQTAGFSNGKRAIAIRMHKRGESVEAIAAS